MNGYIEVKEVIDVSEANSLARKGWVILRVALLRKQISTNDGREEYGDRIVYVLGLPENSAALG